MGSSPKGANAPAEAGAHPGRHALRLPRAPGWLLAVASSVVMGLWMAASALQVQHHADSLLTTLVSLYGWQPFYWDQDRYGMLVPLLTTVVRHPLWNLVVQGVITASLTLLFPIAAARFLSGGGAWWWGGGFANLLLVWFLPDRYVFEWVIGQPYGSALGICALALVALNPDGRARPGLRDAAGLVLLCLGLWVNLSLVVVCVALAGGRLLLTRLRWRRWALEAMWLGVPVAVAAGVSLYLTRQSPFFGTTKMGLVAAAGWPDGWWRFAAQAPVFVELHEVTAVAVLGLAALVARARSRAWRPREWLPAAATALAVFTVLGMLEWSRMSEYDPRYLLPVVGLLAVAVEGFVIPSLSRTRWSAFGVRALTTAALAGVVLFRFGPPSYRTVDGLLDNKFGAYTYELGAAGATHVLGDYWAVWPTVFHVTWRRYESGDPRPFWGLTYRTHSVPERWATLPRATLVIAQFRDDPEVPGYRRWLGFDDTEAIGSSRHFDYVRPR